MQSNLHTKKKLKLTHVYQRVTREWIFIPVPSHSQRKNPIPSQSRTIVIIKILSRSDKNNCPFHSPPVQNYSHSRTALIL